MNNAPILYKLRYFSLFLVILFFIMAFFTSPVNAQPDPPANGDCTGGTSGLGGPNIPDINSDGCVNDTDLAVLLSCWGYTLETAPENCLAPPAQIFWVTIDPSSDTFESGQERSYTIKADSYGVPAGNVNFSATGCSSATCSFESSNIPPDTCDIPFDGGSCEVNLSLTETDGLDGGYQIKVTSNHTRGFTSYDMLNIIVTSEPPTPEFDKGTIFLTSGDYDGDLEGVAWGSIGRANDICQNLADASSFVEPGVWRAWISALSIDEIEPWAETEVSAWENFIGHEPVQLYTRYGTTMNFIASNLSDLKDNGPLHTIDVTDEGIKNTVNHAVWTGTNEFGDSTYSAEITNCNRFMHNGGSIDATIGCSSCFDAPPPPATKWTNEGEDTCTEEHPLYCIWYAPPPPDKGTIFVTSGEYDGGIGTPSVQGSIEAANNICQNLADASSFVEPGVWRAWISAIDEGFNQVSAEENFNGHQPIQLWSTQMTKIADSLSWLIGDGPELSIWWDENLGKRDDDNNVWTGTDPDGNATGLTCDNFMQAVTALEGTVGSTNNTGDTWTQDGWQDCNNTNRLYCIWYDDSIPVPPDPPGEPNIFVSSDVGAGNFTDDWNLQFGGDSIDCSAGNISPVNGQETANCICTGLAYNKPALKNGEWHAWISTHVVGTLACLSNANDNVSSIQNEGMSLYLPDGNKVVDSRDDLWSGDDLLNPINITETGSAATYDHVWTGTNDEGKCDAGSFSNLVACASGTGSWRSAGNPERGTVGSAYLKNSGWTQNYGFSSFERACNQSKAIYCIWYDDSIPEDWVGGVLPPIDPDLPVIIGFDVVAGSAIISWEVKSGESKATLDRIEIWRALDDGDDAPGTWEEVVNLRQNLDGEDLLSHSLTVKDYPPLGTWWYGLHVVDGSNRIGFENTPLPLVEKEGGSIVPSPGADGIYTGSGAFWYVDNSATGDNNGESWSDAWNSFAAIDWSLVKPGDTVYISGGDSFKVYNETLTVGIGKIGAPEARIYITAGQDAGHNGRVIINGQNTRDSGLVITDSDYITVSKLRIQNHVGHDVDIYSGHYVTLDSLDVLVTGRAIFIINGVGNIVRNSYVTTPDDVAHETDGIYSQTNSGNIYEYNTIIIRNTNNEYNDDGIQMYKDTSTIVRGNFIRQINDKNENARGIHAAAMNGIAKFYNNVINLGNAQSSALSFLRKPDQGGKGTVEIVGNTVYSKRALRTVEIDETLDPIVKNNIFFNETVAPVFHLIGGWNGDPSNIDYNLYFTGTPNVATSLNGEFKSWYSWQALGFDEHGINADPEVINIANNYFQLEDSSPAIDAGIDISPYYSIDIDDVSRPQGAGWDMGAYEK